MYLGATRMMPQVPATQAKLKIQRRILKIFCSLFCLVVLLWDCVLVRLYNCMTGERFLNCLWFSPVQHHRHVLPVVSNLTITLHRQLANFDDKCTDGDAEGNDDDAEDDGYDDGDDHDIDLVVSILILNMLGNKSDRVDRLLKMRLLTKLRLSNPPNF